MRSTYTTAEVSVSDRQAKHDRIGQRLCLWGAVIAIALQAAVMVAIEWAHRSGAI